MDTNRHQHFTIPKAIIEFVISNKLERAFSVYLCLKMLWGGNFNESRICFNTISKSIGIKDKRTIVKYIQIMISNGFIGFNRKTKNYFIRGFHFLNKRIGSEGKRCLIVPFERIRDAKNIFAAGLISYKIQGLKLAEKRFLKKRVGSSALIKRGALQKARLLFSMRDYNGLSNNQIANLLGCSKSAANRIKLKCHKLKYITVTKQSKLVARLSESDFNIKRFTPNPERLYTKKAANGEFFLMERLTDEIEPNLFWVKRNRYKAI